MQYISFLDPIQKAQKMALFFVENTLLVNRQKLNLLYFFVDCAYCQKFGRAISEHMYLICEEGPILIERATKNSIADACLSKGILIADNLGFYFPAQGKSFDNERFYILHIEYMDIISAEFHSFFGEDMLEIAYQDNYVWQTAWDNGKGLGKELDLELFFDEPKHKLFRKRTDLSRSAFSSLGF